MAAASFLMRRWSPSMKKVATQMLGARGYAVSAGTDIIEAAPNVSLQKARSWDEGVSSKFSTTPLKDIFKDKKVVIFGLPGAFTGVCSAQHVPSYRNNIEKFKAKGVDSVICVSVNDPYALNGWAEKLQAKDTIEFYGDFDGSFHKSMELGVDLSAALLGPRSHRKEEKRRLSRPSTWKVEDYDTLKAPVNVLRNGGRLFLPKYLGFRKSILTRTSIQFIKV